MENQNPSKSISVRRVDENKCEMYVSPDLSYGEAVQLLSTITLNIMKAFQGVYTKGIHDQNMQIKIRENKHEVPKNSTLSDSELDAACLEATYQIHDTMNIAMSNTLRSFLPPELDFVNPTADIEEEAILRAEEEILNERLASLTPEQKKIANEHLTHIRSHIKDLKDAYAKKQLEEAQNAESTDTDTSDSK